MQEQHENPFIEKNRHRIWFKNRLQILEDGEPYTISADGWIRNTSDQSKIERWFWVSDNRMFGGQFFIRPTRTLFGLIESYFRLKEYTIRYLGKQQKIITDFLSENDLKIENNIYIYDYRELNSDKDNYIRVLEISKTSYTTRDYCEKRGLEIPKFSHSIQNKRVAELTPPSQINEESRMHYSLRGVHVDNAEIVKRILFYKNRARSLQQKKGHLSQIIGFFIEDAYPSYRLLHGEENKKILFVGDYVVIPYDATYGQYSFYRQKDFLRIGDRSLS